MRSTAGKKESYAEKKRGAADGMFSRKEKEKIRKAAEAVARRYSALGGRSSSGIGFYTHTQGCH